MFLTISRSLPEFMSTDLGVTQTKMLTTTWVTFCVYCYKSLLTYLAPHLSRTALLRAPHPFLPVLPHAVGFGSKQTQVLLTVLCPSSLCGQIQRIVSSCRVSYSSEEALPSQASVSPHTIQPLWVDTAYCLFLQGELFLRRSIAIPQFGFQLLSPVAFLLTHHPHSRSLNKLESPLFHECQVSFLPHRNFYCPHKIRDTNGLRSGVAVGSAGTRKVVSTDIAIQTHLTFAFPDIQLTCVKKT